MDWVISRARCWLAPPSFPDDEEKNVQARLMNTAGLYFLLALVGWAVFIIPLFATYMLAAYAILLILFLAYGFARFWLFRGRLFLAWTIMLSTIWLVFAVGVALTGGVNSWMLVGILMTAGVASIFRYRHSGSIFVALSILFVLVLAVLQNSGVALPYVFQLPPLPAWSTFTILLLFLFGFMNLITDNLRISLALARQQSQALLQTEATLVESEARFRSLSENSLASVYAIQDGRFAYINPSMTRLFGYTASELLGSEVVRFIHPDDRALVQEIIRRRIKGEIDSIRYEVRGIHKNGAVLYGEVLGTRIVIDGRPAVLGTVIDMTERKRAEMESARTQALLNAIIHSTSDLIWSVDPEGFGLLVWNQAFAALFRTRLGVELRAGMRLEEMLPAGSAFLEDGYNLYRRALADGPFKIEYPVSAAKQVFELSFNLLRQDGRVLGISIFGNDISELRASEDKFSKAFLSNPAAMSIRNIDDGLRLVDVNRAWEEISGYSRYDSIGTDLSQVSFYPYPQPQDEIVRRILAGEKIQALEIEFRRKSGECGIGLLSTEFIEIGSRKHALLSTIDITARKQAEEKVRKALAEKEALLRELYHRTRNNMSLIIALLEMQAKDTRDDRLKEAFQDIRNRIHSMALVHQKLYDAGDLSQINLREYIDDLVGWLLKATPVSAERIAYVAEMEDVFTLIDTAVPCGLILTELITNALKHAFPGDRAGEIRVCLHRTETGEIHLSVGDNGTGLAPGFDLERDAGLGLQTVFLLAESQLNGSIHLDSAAGVMCRLQFADNQYNARV